MERVAVPGETNMFRLRHLVVQNFNSIFIFAGDTGGGHPEIAVGTGGGCPAYTGHVRKKLEETFTQTHGRFLAELKKLRAEIIAVELEPDRRNTLLGELVSEGSFDYFKENGPAEFHSRAEKLINSRTEK